MRSQSFGGSHFLHSDIFLVRSGHMDFTFENQEFVEPGSADGKRNDVQQQQRQQQARGTTRRAGAEAKLSSFDGTRFMAGTLLRIERATSLPPSHVVPRVHETRTKPTAAQPPVRPWRRRPSVSELELFERVGSRR